MVLVDVAQTCLFVRFPSITSKIKKFIKKNASMFLEFYIFTKRMYPQLFHKTQIITKIVCVIDAL